MRPATETFGDLVIPTLAARALIAARYAWAYGSVACDHATLTVACIGGGESARTRHIRDALRYATMPSIFNSITVCLMVTLYCFYRLRQ